MEELRRLYDSDTPVLAYAFRGKRSRSGEMKDLPGAISTDNLPVPAQTVLIEYNRSTFFEEAVMQRKNVPLVLILSGILLVCTTSVLGQASPSGQSSASSGVSEQDIEMLRADLRSQRKQVTAQNMISPDDLHSGSV